MAWGIFENGQRIFEQLKRSEFKNENPLTFLRRLKELYSSEKKSKEQFNDCSFFICRTDGH